MADETWVGFAKSPKPDPNLSRLRVEETFDFSMASEKVFQMVTSASGLSAWLHETDKSEVRTSGKIRFSNVAQGLELAVFSHVDIGRKAVMNSELFGEVEVLFQRKSPTISVSFTKMVNDDERSEFQKLFEKCLADLKVLVT